MTLRLCKPTVGYAPRAALVSQRLRAFTLIELLVAVAIIALLIAILIPSVRQAKRQAESAACKANLHSLANCGAMYEGEWGILMPASDTNGFGRTWAGPDKVGFIYPYLNNPTQLDVLKRNKIWTCPSMERDPNVVAQQEDYGINSYPYDSVSRTLPPLKLVDIKNPARTMMFADIGYSRTLTAPYLTTTQLMSYPTTDCILYIRFSLPNGCSTGPFNARHAGTKGNVAWYDGHVDEQRATIPTDLGVWTDYMNKVHSGSLTPITTPVTLAQLQSNRTRNTYFFSDPDSGRLVQSPQSGGSW